MDPNAVEILNNIQLPEIRMRATPAQFACLIDFMERHGDQLRPSMGICGRVRADILWHQCTQMLNSVPGGTTKTVDRWKKVWSDWKNNTKKKAVYIRRHPNGKQRMTINEERLIALIKKRDSRVSRPDVLMADIDGEKKLYKIIIHSKQAKICGVPSSGDESNSMSITQPDAVEFAVKSEPIDNDDYADVENTIDIQDEPLPQFPEPLPPSPQPSPPSPEPLPPSPAPQAEPQVLSSKSRRRFRAQSSSPFVRISSEFFALEHRRLKFEEERDKRRHEREMERLRLETQRIEVQRVNNELKQILLPMAKTVTEALQQSFAKHIVQEIVRNSENYND